MIRVTSALAALAVAGGATAAQAQVGETQLYGTLGYSQKTEREVGAVQLRLGARLGSYFGVEGEYGLGVKSDTRDFIGVPNVPDANFKTKQRHEVAVYAVGYLPITPQADVFARVGYGNTWFKSRINLAPTGPVSGKFDDSSFNLGAGAQYFFDANNGVRADYVRQDYSDLPTEDVWSIAYTRRF